MPTATLTSKGQITIPKDLRAEMRLSSGDRLEFARNSAGEVVIRRARPRKSAFGSLAKYVPEGFQPPTVPEMNDAIGKAVSARYLRVLRQARK